MHAWPCKNHAPYLQAPGVTPNAPKLRREAGTESVTNLVPLRDLANNQAAPAPSRVFRTEWLLRQARWLSGKRPWDAWASMFSGQSDAGGVAVTSGKRTAPPGQAKVVEWSVVWGS